MHVVCCSGEGLLQRCFSWLRAEKLEGGLCVNRQLAGTMLQRPRFEGTHTLGLRKIQATTKCKRPVAAHSSHVQPATLLLLLAGATLTRRVRPELDRVLLSADIEARVLRKFLHVRLLFSLELLPFML